MAQLECSFFRNEADNTMHMIIQADSSWLEKDIDIQLLADNRLALEVPDIDTFISGYLPDVLVGYMNSNPMQILFCDEQTHVLADITIDCLSAENDVDSEKNLPLPVDRKLKP